MTRIPIHKQDGEVIYLAGISCGRSSLSFYLSNPIVLYATIQITLRNLKTITAIVIVLVQPSS